MRRRAEALALGLIALALWGRGLAATAAPAPLPVTLEAPYRGVPGGPLVWLGRTGRLAYLGQAPGGGVLLAWDVAKHQVGRLGMASVTALDASGDGRLAWVERHGFPLAERAASPAGLPGRGPDKLWVQDLSSGRRVEVLQGVELQPRCLAFDRRQNRLACVLRDDAGAMRVAVQASGEPLALWHLDPTVRLRRLVGWLDNGEVLVEADRPGRLPALVAVQARAARILPHLEGATLSSDGRTLLGRAAGAGGLMVRGAGGGGRWLAPGGEAFAWAAHPSIAFVALGQDLLVLGLDGRLQRRYTQALPGQGLGPLLLSADPSGRFVGMAAGDRLWVRRL